MWLIAKPKEAGRPGEEKIRDKARKIETQFLLFVYIRPTLNACLDIVAQQCVVVRNDALGTFHAVMHAPKVQLKLDKHCQRRIFYEQYFRLACQDFHGLKIFNVRWTSYFWQDSTALSRVSFLPFISLVAPTFLAPAFQNLADARLAQPVERKALNLVVVGSSPTVGVPVGNWTLQNRFQETKGLDS